MSELTKFETGAVRSSDRKNVRYDLITPIGLRRVAEAYSEGSKKYSEYNCEKGMPISDLINHAVAHIYAYMSGDRSEDHLGHASWNLLMACHSDEKWPHLNQMLRGPDCACPLPVQTQLPQMPSKAFFENFFRNNKIDCEFKEDFNYELIHDLEQTPNFLEFFIRLRDLYQPFYWRLDGFKFVLAKRKQNVNPVGRSKRKQSKRTR